jgi:hypothetical protein
MPVYLYCIVPAGVAPPRELAGLDALPVRALDVGALSAWVSDFTDAHASSTLARARAHDLVVRAAMLQATPLPARFGQVLADDSALRETLAGREAGLRTALHRVRGAVEMNVNVLLDEGPADVPSVPAMGAEEGSRGRAHMERLRARVHAETAMRRRADFLQDRIRHVVAPFVRAEVRLDFGPRSRSLPLAHLVPHEHLTQYRAALAALRDREPELKLMLSGPWAPYSFASDAR